MVDYYIWPFIERMPVVTADTGVNPMDEEKHRKLFAWRDAMLELPAIKSCLISTENHLRYAELYRKGEPEYDFMFV